MTVKRSLTKYLSTTFARFLFDPFEEPINNIRLIYIVLSTTFMLFGLICVWIIPLMSDDIESVVCVGYGAAGTMALINYYLLLSGKRRVADLLINVDNGIYKYRYEENRLAVSYKGLSREENIVRLSKLLNAIFYCNALTAVAISMINRFVRNDLNALVYPSWYPWSSNDISGYLASLSVQLAVSYYVCASTLGNVVYIVSIYLEYKRQYKRLRQALVNISKSIEVSTTTTSSDFEEKIYHRRRERFASDLIECINHHRALRKNFEYFRSYFETYFSLEFCSCVLTLSWSLHALLEALENGKAPMTIALVSHLLQGLFLKCYVGEKFSELNDEITDAIYDLPWYDQTANRKLLHIFQMQTQRPYVLKGLKVFPASLFVFAKVIKTAYTFLNIIRAS